jgi:predicted methyltransferase
MTTRLRPRFTLAGNRYTKGPENRLVESLKKYKPLLEKVEMPPEKWRVAQRREHVAEQLIKMGVDKYTAYALAVRKIPK